MRVVSETEAKRRFNELLKTAQREPVMIRRQNCDAAVIVSTAEYEKIRRCNIAEFQRLCDRIGAEAVKRGMTQEILADF